jgi:hypothetical protein
MINERIKQLAEQATIRGEEYLPGCAGHPTPTVYFDKEKFAELIVRECAGLNFRELGLSGSSSFDVSRMIKQHFGVEN